MEHLSAAPGFGRLFPGKAARRERASPAGIVVAWSFVFLPSLSTADVGHHGWIDRDELVGVCSAVRGDAPLPFYHRGDALYPGGDYDLRGISSKET